MRRQGSPNQAVVVSCRQPTGLELGWGWRKAPLVVEVRHREDTQLDIVEEVPVEPRNADSTGLRQMPDPLCYT